MAPMMAAMTIQINLAVAACTQPRLTGVVGLRLTGNPSVKGLRTVTRSCPRPCPCLSREVRNSVVDIVGRLLLRLLLRGHCHPDAVDKLAAKQGLLTAQRDDVADPVLRVITDASTQD